MPKDLSSTPTVLIARVNKLLGLTESTLYYWDGDGSIRSQLTSGSAPNLLLVPLNITDFAVDGLSIYLDQYQGDTLVRLDTVTKVVTVLLPQEFGRDPIVFDANNVYTGRSTLMRMPKIQDGLAFPLVTTTAGNVLAPLFSDGITLYYRKGSSTVAGNDVLKSMPAYGGASTPLVTGLAIKYLIGDATALYWVDSIIGGTAISRMCLGS